MGKKKLKWLLSDSGRKTSAKDLARITLRKRKREGLCYSAGVKETEDKGEVGGEKGKGKRYLSQSDSGLPLDKEETDLEHGKMAI